MSSILERDRMKIDDYARQYLSRGDENIWNQIMPIIDNYTYFIQNSLINDTDRLLNMLIPIGPQYMNKSTNILFTIVGINSKISLENPEIVIEKIKILLEKGSSLYIFDDLHLGALYRSAHAINNKIIFDSIYEDYEYDKYNTDILDFLLEQIVFGMKNRSMFLKIYKDDLQKIYSLDEKLNNEETGYIPLDNKLSVGIGSYIMGKANDLFYIKDDELKTIQSKKRLSVAKQLDPRLGKDVTAIIKDYDMMQTIMGYVDDMNLNKKDYDKFKKEEKEVGVPENLQNEYTSQYLDEYSKFGGKKYKGGINSSQNLDEELNSLVSQPNELQRQDTLPFVDSNDNDDSNDVFEELESELKERDEIEQLTSRQRIKGNYFFYLSAHGDLNHKTPIQYTENSRFPPEFKWYNNWYSDENTFTNLKKINLIIYKNSVCTDIVPVRAFTRGEEITFNKQKFTEYLKIIIDIKPKSIVSEIYLYNPDENNYELFYDLETGVNYNIPNITYTFNNDFSMGIVESVKISNDIFQTSPEYLYEGKTQWNPDLVDSSWTAQLLDHDTDPGFTNSIIKQVINKLPNDMEEETIDVTLFNSTCLNTKISNINKLVETYPEWSNIYKDEIIITIKNKLKNLNIKRNKLIQNITDNNNKISKLLKEKTEIIEKIQKLDENKWELGDEMGKKEVEELQEKYIDLDDEKISISNQIIIISRDNKEIEDKLKNINAKINEANKQLKNINSNKKRRKKGGNSDEMNYETTGQLPLGDQEDEIFEDMIVSENKLNVDTQMLPELSNTESQSLKLFSESEEQLEIKNSLERYYQNPNIEIGNYYYYLSSHGHLVTEDTINPKGIENIIDTSYFPEETEIINFFIKKRAGCLNVALVGDFTDGKMLEFEEDEFQNYLQIVIKRENKFGVIDSKINEIYLYNSKINKYVLFYNLETGVNYNIPNILFAIDGAFNSGLLELLKIDETKYQPTSKHLKYNKDKELKVVWPYPEGNLVNTKEDLNETKFHLTDVKKTSLLNKILDKLPKNTNHKIYNVNIFLSSCLYSEESDKFIQQFNNWANIFSDDMFNATNKQLLDTNNTYSNYYSDNYLQTVENHKNTSKLKKYLDLKKKEIIINTNIENLNKNISFLEKIIKKEYRDETNPTKFINDFEKYITNIIEQYKKIKLESQFKNDSRFKTPKFLNDKKKYDIFKNYVKQQKLLNDHINNFMKINNIIEKYDENFKEILKNFQGIDHNKKLNELTNTELDFLYKNIENIETQLKEQTEYLQKLNTEKNIIEKRLKVLNTVKKLDMPTIFENTEGYTTRSKIKRPDEPTESKKKTKLKGGVNTEKIFNITDEFCLFNGNILDFESPIDKTKISKVNPYENNFVQSCNEYKIGLKLKKYSEFLTADNCEVITRVKEGDDYYYDNDRDEFIFNECIDLIKDSEKIEVYVYEKSGKDLQYYFDNPLELEKLLTRNRTISIYDGINILIVYFTNILSILKSEKIIHKDIKPGNIIVGNDLHNFPRNIKIIDLGFSFHYRNLSDFMLNQAIDLFGDDVLEELKKDSDIDDFSELSHRFSLDYYDKWDENGLIDIFNVITGVATPLYAAPDFDLRLREWSLSPTIGSLITPDPGNQMLNINRIIPKYIINNEYDIDYTKLAELYVTDNGDYFDLIKKNIIPDYFINSVITYNNQKNTNYNLFEFIYLMANGLTGPEPILYKYDLYAFGLILRQLVDVYTDALEKNLLFDPRKYRAKTKPKTRQTRKNTRKGGTIPKTFDYTSREHFKELDEINYVINNMINPDCIYRWTSNDLMSYYQNIEISSEKYITIKGEEYLLCSEEITKESIIKQFQIINPKLNEYIKPEPPPDSTEVNWDSIRTQLKESGLNARKIGLTITKMKKRGLTSIDQL
jgi:hypothetical protein